MGNTSARTANNRRNTVAVVITTRGGERYLLHRKHTPDALDPRWSLFWDTQRPDELPFHTADRLIARPSLSSVHTEDLQEAFQITGIPGLPAIVFTATWQDQPQPPLVPGVFVSDFFSADELPNIPLDPATALILTEYLKGPTHWNAEQIQNAAVAHASTPPAEPEPPALTPVIPTFADLGPRSESRLRRLLTTMPQPFASAADDTEPTAAPTGVAIIVCDNAGHVLAHHYAAAIGRSLERWLIPYTLIADGEGPEDAAMRAVFDGSKIVITDNILDYLFTHTDPDDPDKVTAIFAAHWNGNPATLNLEGVTNSITMAPGDLLRCPMPRHLKSALRRYRIGIDRWNQLRRVV
ncbi:NUDIX hydrolase [Kitasatospora sp. NPDC028055]|uniref:NUDIX hydrolase n=1 Tax=Kitasatospora sp. NPDC028055 TaxID=3155653 RepID=UPI0033F2E030